MLSVVQNKFLMFIYILGLGFCFAVGRWWGHLSASLETESKIPYDLQSYALKFPSECESLKKNGNETFPFLIDLSADKKVIRILTYDIQSESFFISLLDGRHRIFSDSFPSQCSGR